MSTLGEIYFQDAHQNEHITSIYDAITLADLELFALSLESFTLAGIVGVNFSEDAEIFYEDGVKNISYNSPSEWKALDIPPDTGNGFTACELLTVYMRRKQPNGRRAFSIPAPRLSLLKGARLQEMPGQTLTALFHSLTGENVFFQSGRLITPKK